jgi:hypothetical protein
MIGGQQFAKLEKKLDTSKALYEQALYILIKMNEKALETKI